MKFVETRLTDAFIVDPERFEDERGYFARNWSQREFEAAGLETSFVECNVSFNRRTGTLRGMHYQEAPYEQVKLVRCTRGAIYDVIVDLRPASATFKQWLGVELTAANGRILYVPASFAHGFQTLADDTEVSYQMSSYFEPASGRGVRWNDPAFAIEWPETDQRIIISRDREYPDFR
jgi:dTDP-4-dehydrorhamnose 3,5-epimerase